MLKTILLSGVAVITLAGTALANDEGIFGFMKTTGLEHRTTTTAF